MNIILYTNFHKIQSYNLGKLFHTIRWFAILVPLFLFVRYVRRDYFRAIIARVFTARLSFLAFSSIRRAIPPLSPFHSHGLARLVFPRLSSGTYLPRLSGNLTPAPSPGRSPPFQRPPIVLIRNYLSFSDLSAYTLANTYSLSHTCRFSDVAGKFWPDIILATLAVDLVTPRASTWIRMFYCATLTSISR